MSNIKAITWDFDGVIILSDGVREKGFRQVLAEYSPDDVEKLLKFHRANGGLSRYVKIRYFFENIIKESIQEQRVQGIANRFSAIMRKELIDPMLLNPEWVQTIDHLASKYSHHIVSGSDGEELKYLCKGLGINHYFKSIYGSPSPKGDLIKKVMNEGCYGRDNMVMVGDSINDYDAAKETGIGFIGYRNKSLILLGPYLTELSSLDLFIKEKYSFKI